MLEVENNEQENKKISNVYQFLERNSVSDLGKYFKVF